ncbi:30S ribosomal protein S7 [Microgenomates group bacterium RBG_16_45_19]|nr:MAG: 30S ribosomal protein S7 [Microgenomates group bacterium RBG_16_45_19]
MRAKTAKIRPARADPLYQSVELNQLVNRVMFDGKKSVALKQVYQALTIIKESGQTDPLAVFNQAIANIIPKMEVRSRRVGGAAYQVPMPVRPRRAFALAVRWLVIEARKRSSAEYHTFAAKLAAELLDAVKNEGGSVQKKLTTHKMAEANKAFAHFRW